MTTKNITNPETNTSAVINDAQQTAIAPLDNTVQEQDAKNADHRKAIDGADKLLAKAMTQFRKGQGAYLDGMVKAGEYIFEYVVARMQIVTTFGDGATGAARTQALKAVDGQLAQYSDTTVNPNTLIRVYWADKLLQTGKKKVAVSYYAMREGWSQLIEAQNQGTPDETYVLIPGFETECLETFQQHGADANGKTALELAKTIQRKYATALHERTQAAYAEATKQADKAKQEHLEAEQSFIESRTQAEELETQAKAEKDAKAKAELTAKAEQAKAELLASQEQAAAKAKEKELADQRAARSKKEASEAEKRQKKLEAKKEKAEKARDAKTRSTPIQDAKPDATPESLASMIYELVSECEPDKAELVLKCLIGHYKAEDDNVYSERLKRAAQAFMYTWTRHEVDSRLEANGKPEANGKLETAAA